jgi:hypothetical protein
MMGGNTGKSPGARLSMLPPKRGTIVPGNNYADMVRGSLKKPSGEDKFLGKKPSNED